jgi:hypothetical protein
MNALNIAKPSRVINLAYFLGSDYPPRIAFKLNILGMDTRRAGWPESIALPMRVR